MATKEEKKTVPTPAEGGAPEQLGTWQKLNEFGERNAKVIITVSAGLIILTVLLFAKIFYDRTLLERAARDLSQAEKTEDLVKLKSKYKDTPVAAEIVYRLANRYNEEGKLDEADKEYTEFKSRFEKHPFRPLVDKAHADLLRNRKFLETDRDQRLKVRLLQTHPEERQKIDSYVSQIPEDRRGKVNTSYLDVGPDRMPNPELQIEIAGKGTFWVELFEDEAPNTVYNFLKLVEEKALEGQKFVKSGDVFRLEKPVDYVLEFEKTEHAQEAVDFLLVARRSGEDLPGATFEILTKPTPQQPDATVFGKVTAYWKVVEGITPEDTIKSITVKTRREAKFEPKRMLPKPELKFTIEGKGEFTVELFEDETPNTVKNLVKLVEEKAFDGLKFAKVAEGLRLTKPAPFFVKFESSNRAAKEGFLVVRKAEGRQDVAGATFDILLRDPAETVATGDWTVVGRVKGDRIVLMGVTEEDAVKSVTVVRKRSTPYEPERITP